MLLNDIGPHAYVVLDTSLETEDSPTIRNVWKKPDREFLAVGAKIDSHTSSDYQMFDTSQGTFHRSNLLNFWKNPGDEFTTSPIGVRLLDDDDLYNISAFQIGRKAWVDEMVEYLSTIATMKTLGLGQVRLRQLIESLREIEANKTADRIEYLASEENIDDGGDIPAIASIDTFVTFYVDNIDLGEPILGTTPNAELQAVWVFSDGRRFVAEFLPDDTVRFVYRRTGPLGLSKLFVTSRQPREQVRSQLGAASI